MENVSATLKSFVENDTRRGTVDELKTAIAIAFFYPMAFFGVIANTITFIVIYKAPSLRSIFNFYIMSLCISDLISAMVSPLFVYRLVWGWRYENWKIPHFFCKIYWSAEMGTCVITSFHVAAFSALRFLSIAKPHLFRKITLTQAKISIMFIWILSIGLGFVPYAILMDVNKPELATYFGKEEWTACAISLEWLFQYQAYTTYVNILMFMMPLSVIFVFSFATSLLIYIRRWQRNKARKKRPHGGSDETERNRRMKENHAILQLALIVGSFAIGYIPTTVFLKMAPHFPTDTYEGRIRQWWYGCISCICLRFGECLNPIFYNMASSKLRAESTKWFRKVFRCQNDEQQAQNTIRRSPTANITSVAQ